MKCPRCKEEVEACLAMSRRDNKTMICGSCGTNEALFDFRGATEQEMAEERAWLK